jgi:hypothetical protein
MTVGELVRLAALITGDECNPVPSRAPKMQIVVLERGFVYIGMVTVDGGWVYVNQARNIRKWGTTKGLGELVNGPLKDTILDRVGTLKAPLRSLVSLIDVEESKWRP